MGGRAGLIGLVETLLGLLGLHLQPWMAPAGVLLVVALAWPLMRSNFETDDARKLLKHAQRETGAERQRLEGQALLKVRGKPVGLVVVAETALQVGRTDLARAAIDQLRATGKRPVDVRRLERILEGPQPGTALEAALTVERLAQAGMKDEAREKLARYRQRWPADEELAGLEARI